MLDLQLFLPMNVPTDFSKIDCFLDLISANGKVNLLQTSLWE